MSTVATTPVALTGQDKDPMQTRIALVARKHGMTVEQWEEHCDRLEEHESSKRDIARIMQARPRYRGVAA